MRVEFKVPGDPRGKQRPRVVSRNGFSKAYTPQETVVYENLVKFVYSQQVGVKLEGEIRAEILCLFSIPKSVSKKQRAKMLAGDVLHTKKPDCDNIAKIILDSLNGIAYDDDKQVCQLEVQKYYGEESCVIVSLIEIEHNKNKED